MKKLSLKESKKRCAELWNWIADNPEKEKEEWTSWIENGGNLHAIHYCFACEHSKIHSNGFQKCNRCFLLNLWFGGEVPKDINRAIEEGSCLPCEDVQNSPYKLFKIQISKDNYKEASFYARKIADYCKKH